MYHTSFVGGTFDRLHKGHEHLLRTAIEHTIYKLVIGLTTSFLHQHKKYKEYIQSFHTRKLQLEKFINNQESKIILEIIPIKDSYEPLVSRKDIRTIFVSNETFGISLLINKMRKSKGIRQLHIHNVDLILKNNVKVSSTDKRKKYIEKQSITF